MNLISIIMPCYNMEKYISSSIDTVLSQSYSNWELIIVNDASTDNSENVINSYISMDPRIKRINLPQNSGIASARNAGMAQASGNFLAFLDSDDFWLPQKLEQQLAFMLEKNIAFSYTAYHQVAENGSYVRTIHVPETLDYFSLLKKSCIGCLTVMINKSLIGDFSMPLMRHEDYATWLMFLRERIPTAYGINTPLAKYNVRLGSTSRNKIKSMHWVYSVYRKQEHISIPLSLFYICVWIYRTIFVK